MIKIKRCLISVSDKEGIVSFANELSSLGVEIIASGGTAKTLKESGIDVSLIDEITGFPEILGGRIKTLHPIIYGGILAKREKSHLDELESHNIKPIDMVVCNLYPFEKKITKDEGRRTKDEIDEVIEEIDIGGVSLIRAGAKNHKYVVVVVSKERYSEIIDALLNNSNYISDELSYSLATESFNYTAHYDSVIANWFLREDFPDTLNLSYKKGLSLRYGENPHQRASFYVKDKMPFEKISGSELSYNNILDLDSAVNLTSEFEKPGCVIVKHNIPCGVAISEDIYSAYKLAYESDPISAFGGIIAFNTCLDIKTGGTLSKTFYEAIIAPDFEKEVKELFEDKKIRLVKSGFGVRRSGFGMREALGGLLIQDEDKEDYKDLSYPTKKRPTSEERDDLIFGYKVCKYVKSNAIVIVKDKKTLGICGGQTNRVDAARIAIERAGDKAKGACLASDGFFPFSDSVEVAGKFGISSIIQPGGSIRDNEVIEKADSFGISMIFANVRHFRH